jgi:hypothetical protein
MYGNIAVLFAFAFIYSLLAGWLERTPFTGALVFTTFGLAAGPAGVNLLTLDINTEILRVLAELTLALVLFTDAAKSLYANYAAWSCWVLATRRRERIEIIAIQIWAANRSGFRSKTMLSRR